jgi:hypothetical protein
LFVGGHSRLRRYTMRTTREASSTILSTSGSRSPGRTTVSRLAAAKPPHVRAASSIHLFASSSGRWRNRSCHRSSSPEVRSATPFASASALPVSSPAKIASTDD